MWSLISRSNFLSKVFYWEFWPAWLANIPVVFFWLYFAIRSRDLFFFSAVNPGIETGGVMGESKINILNRIPSSILPNTLFIDKTRSDFTTILLLITEKELGFPVICKPNVGERGHLVEKIENHVDLKHYWQRINVDFLIQEYVDLPTELSVLCYRSPTDGKGAVTSICRKKNLAVVGDGRSTVAALMRRTPRARFQLRRFEKNQPHLLRQIPKEAEKVVLEPIGNHCRGTLFLNANEKISKELEDYFIGLIEMMEGIHYGRFDLKCASIDGIGKGEDIKVLEFNGVASEPAHIYDPKYSTRRGYGDLFKHWKIIYFLAKQQKAQGIQSMTLKEAWQSMKDYLVYMRSTTKAWQAATAE